MAMAMGHLDACGFVGTLCASDLASLCPRAHPEEFSGAVLPLLPDEAKEWDLEVLSTSFVPPTCPGGGGGGGGETTEGKGGKIAGVARNEVTRWHWRGGEKAAAAAAAAAATTDCPAESYLWGLCCTLSQPTECVACFDEPLDWDYHNRHTRFLTRNEWLVGETWYPHNDMVVTHYALPADAPQPLLPTYWRGGQKSSATSTLVLLWKEPTFMQISVFSPGILFVVRAV